MVADRPQSDSEELANSASHAIGLVLAVAAMPVLIDLAATSGRTVDLIGAWVFCSTMILVYLASAIYHALPEGRTKRMFNRLDHAAIFLFIAGSYTPFSLGALEGPGGWMVFGLVWAFAAAGVVLKVLHLLTNRWLSLGMYLSLGWLVLIAALPLMEQISTAAVGLLLGGGATYTAGAVFFVLDSRVRYGHFIWHLFVLAGSTCHFLAALWHAHGSPF